MFIGYITALFLLLVNSVSPLNILAIYPYPGKSHFLVFRVFLRELANRGHDVTVISHFPEKDPPKNYYDINLSGTLEEDAFDITPDNIYWIVLLSALYMGKTGTENCEVMLGNQQVQKLIKQKPKFDVVLLEQFNSDCALGIAYKLGSPVVATTSHVLMPYHFDRFGIPSNPSYVSFHFLGGGTKPSFFQRLERVFFNFFFKTTYYWLSQRNNQNTLAKYFDDIPPLEELAREIKFLLVYHNFVLTGSKVLPANVIEVGGYHVTKAQPLSGDLKKFVEDSEHGVVYISFGSIFKASSLPADKVNAVFEAMNEFPQRFIWKCDNNTLAVDKNKVYVDGWLPQVDILGHPKTLAFLSHAGMGSTTEAINFGVPIIAMPLFGDQPSNAAAIEESGFGVQLLYRDLNKENLVAALKQVLDSKFREKVKEVSSAWHDRPMSPLDTAVFWTEFAARHPTLSFRTRAADVPFYQYMYLDIIAIVLLMCLVVFRVLGFCCRMSKNIKSPEPKRGPRNKRSKRD